MTLARSDAAAAASPGNHWLRLEGVLHCLRLGMASEALRRLEALSGSPQIGPEIISGYRTLILANPMGLPASEPLRGPGDGFAGQGFCPPLASLPADRKLPPGFPVDMVLPAPNRHSNDFRFLACAADQAGPGLATSRLHIVAQTETDEDVQALRRFALRQGLPKVRLLLTVFAPPGISPIDLPLPADWQNGTPWQRPREQQVSLLGQGADILLFLGPGTLPDATLAERALQYCGGGAAVLMPLVELESIRTPDTPGPTVLSNRLIHQGWTDDPWPFSRVTSLNFAVSASNFRGLGGFDPGFRTEAGCATEFAFRLWNSGGYLQPLACDGPVSLGGPVPPEDTERLARHCPALRKTAGHGRFAVPKVSIYIPAHNAGRYISEAVESVLMQDFEDLEVCIADDGSSDDTRSRLNDRFGDDPRLRWISQRNGGIGAASNAAIAMARGLYIGQLDADDRLKPGAVRRLAGYLDNNPHLGCVYSSCERIDAEGHYLQNEYSYPDFSHEKLMMTSVVHHFRMFRRQTWGRTAGFRTDIANAVDYDMFLKMAEIAPFHHLEEVLYQRRWHGGNTSQLRETEQGHNTHFAQRSALTRMGLDRYRELQIPDPKTPRRVTYKRRGPRVFFWPDYSRYNPYQRLLYASARDKAEFIGADIDTALHVLSADPGDPGKTSFHLHWLNKVTSQARSKQEAKAQAGSFLTKLQSFKGLGGRLIWTVHNVLSHDTPWPEAETALAQGIIALADHVHLHSAASLQETSSAFTIPKEKLTILPHGNYAGWYPEYISRGQARAALGLSATDDVILVPGQIRPYKGVGDLIAATRSVLHERPNARLLIAGQMSDDVHAALLSAAGRDAQNQLRLINRFIDDAELQLFFGAADFAVLPYRRVLTSGSLILALGFGVPVVVPDVGMTRQVIAGSKAGLLCNAADGMALETAVRRMLRHKDQGHLPEMRLAARERAAALSWGDFSNML